jgi:hypothetical protein
MKLSLQQFSKNLDLKLHSLIAVKYYQVLQNKNKKQDKLGKNKKSDVSNECCTKVLRKKMYFCHLKILKNCVCNFLDLRREKGLTTWKVLYEDKFFSSFKEFKKSPYFQRQLEMHKNLSTDVTSDIKSDRSEQSEESSEWTRNEPIRITRSMFPPSPSQHETLHLLQRYSNQSNRNHI